MTELYEAQTEQDFDLIKSCPELLLSCKQTPSLCLKVIEFNVRNIRYINEVTEELFNKAIKVSNTNTKNFDESSESNNSVIIEIKKIIDDNKYSFGSSSTVNKISEILQKSSDAVNKKKQETCNSLTILEIYNLVQNPSDEITKIVLRNSGKDCYKIYKSIKNPTNKMTEIMLEKLCYEKYDRELTKKMFLVYKSIKNPTNEMKKIVINNSLCFEQNHCYEIYKSIENPTDEIKIITLNHIKRHDNYYDIYKSIKNPTDDIKINAAIGSNINCHEIFESIENPSDYHIYMFCSEISNFSNMNNFVKKMGASIENMSEDVKIKILNNDNIFLTSFYSFCYEESMSKNINIPIKMYESLKNPDENIIINGMINIIKKIIENVEGHYDQSKSESSYRNEERLSIKKYNINSLNNIISLHKLLKHNYHKINIHILKLIKTMDLLKKKYPRLKNAYLKLMKLIVIMSESDYLEFAKYSAESKSIDNEFNEYFNVNFLKLVQNPSQIFLSSVIEQNWHALRYISAENQTIEICEKAINQSIFAHLFVKKKSHQEPYNAITHFGEEEYFLNPIKSKNS